MKKNIRILLVSLLIPICSLGFNVDNDKNFKPIFVELLDKEGIETIESEQATRYDELERLEWQFDIEVDIPTGDAKESAAIPVTSGALSDEV